MSIREITPYKPRIQHIAPSVLLLLGWVVAGIAFIMGYPDSLHSNSGLFIVASVLLFMGIAIAD